MSRLAVVAPNFSMITFISYQNRPRKRSKDPYNYPHELHPCRLGSARKSMDINRMPCVKSWFRPH